MDTLLLDGFFSCSGRAAGFAGGVFVMVAAISYSLASEPQLWRRWADKLSAELARRADQSP